MSNPYEGWLSERFPKADIARMREVFVQVAPDHRIDLVDLVLAWNGHVERIERELTTSSDEPTAWGAYDLVAALCLRDFLRDGLSGLGEGLRQRVELPILDIDNRFIAYTELDNRGLVERIDGRSRPSSEWWWHRIPRSGPVREDILRSNGIE